MKKEALDIIMLSDFDRNGGGRETWLYNFLPELLEDQCIKKVHLFGYSNNLDNNISKSSFFCNTKANKYKLEPVVLIGRPSKLPMALSMFFKLRKYKTTKKPSITLAMGVFELLMMLFVRRFNNTKKVVWLRSIFTHEKAYAIPKFLRKTILSLEIYFLRKADVIISNGDDIKSFYEKYGLEVSVIKNGIDYKKWKIPSPKLNDPLHVAFVGRLSQIKGIESYLELAETVKKGEHHANFVFHIVGKEGVYKEKVLTLVKENVVINHGVIANQDLPFFLNKIDVCVALTFASDKGGGGGTSNAMLEQMAASRIMLAWDNIIFRQYLDEDNAYLVDQYNIKGLEEAILLIKNDIKLARTKSVKAHETIIPYTYFKNVYNFKKLVLTCKSY